MLEAINPALSPLKNQLLAALTPEEQGRLFPHLELVMLPIKQELYGVDDKVTALYFPIDVIVSLLHVMESGASAETAMVGKEGLVGFASFMGGESSSSRAIVQSAGYAYRLKGSVFITEFQRHGELLDLVLRYMQSLITQKAQTAVCNRHHSIDQQFCRWLLMSIDRLPDNHLAITHELIANMLGVRREGITEAAGKLQKLGVIEHHRGHITVLDRQALEALSCECYAVVKKETDRLLPPLLTPHHSHLKIG
ncbi:Crp/Fnr family transcriptional regulator [Marinomonas arenicola]|uniref:Crp/Fnr family transcriptional regulator n=1 Tax=Marinomonas arenicola TaxID=569601 RepID=A0ABU9G3N5_9GAMM